MLAIRSLFLIALFASSFSIAKPIEEVYKLRYERADAVLDARDDANLTGPVTFQTVTTTETQAGTITQTCTVTLTPFTAADGTQQVLKEKQCNLVVGSANSAPPSNDGNGSSSSDSNGQTTTAVDSTATDTAGTTFFVTSPAATNVPAISEIGTGVISATPIASDSSASAPAATSSDSAPPAISVVGPNQIPNSSTDGAASSSAATTPVTVVTTLSNGQVSTSVSTPSAAAAQEAAATTPGRKLEVLPIGLGVFAGVSVIALIVVGLVTYERTKYRKAFRQRKLAEAGANMGYGGMAERT